MRAKTRMIEVDATTAKTLEERAAAFGVSVADYVADLAANDFVAERLESMRRAGRGPWSPSVLAEDVRRYEEYKRTGLAVPGEEVHAWIESLGTAHELPMPKPRKV